MHPSTRNPRRGEQGVALIYVAVFLLVSLWFVSLAIDVGKLMAARTELQAAADAAALAGASALNTVTGETDPVVAKARAAATAGSNRAYQGVKTPVVINPDVDVTFPGTRQVRVQVYRNADHGDPVLLHFAQTLGLPSMGVQADAIAKADPLIGVCEGLAPFAPEQQPGGFSKACGTWYQLKLGAGNSTAGNFQLLDFPNCAENGPPPNGGGAAEIKYYIVNGWDCCFKIGDLVSIDTAPGNKVGKVRDGLQERWDADTDKRPNICYQDYIGNQKRVFLCPVIADFNVNGRSQVQILKFAAFFLKERPTGNFVTDGVWGQFIDYIAPGIVGDIPPDSTSVYGVHLIE